MWVSNSQRRHFTCGSDQIHVTLIVQWREPVLTQAGSDSDHRVEKAGAGSSARGVFHSGSDQQ